MAERSGFEPEKGLTPYPLSRRALSSTQPSLRDDPSIHDRLFRLEVGTGRNVGKLSASGLHVAGKLS